MLFVPPIALDRDGATPLYVQICRQLAAAARCQGAAPARLPSTRLLARMLGVSRRTIVTAYEELVAAGVIEGRSRSAMVIADRQQPAVNAFDPQRALRDAHYPARTLAFQDPDGGSLYLNY